MGIANLTDSEQAPAAIDSLRAQVAPQGYRLLETPSIRRALEAAVPQPSSTQVLGQARSLVQSAKDAYADFTYELALTRLQAVDALLLSLPPSARVVDLLVERHILAALVYDGIGDESRVLEAFRIVQRLQPERRALDPGFYRPRIVALFQKAKEAAAVAPAIALQSEPAGAELWLDGRPIGKAPQTLDALAVGSHYLAAVLPGHRPRAEILEVSARSAGERLYRLSEKPTIERIVALRRKVIASPKSADWDSVGATLAALARVDLMVLIRTRAGGELEAAVFQNGALGPWIVAPSSRLVASLRAETRPQGRSDPTGKAATPADSATAPVATRTSLDRAILDSAAGLRDRRSRHRSWYRKWWGIAIIGGSAALLGTAIYAVAAGRTPDYEIGDICFDRTGCP